MKVLEPSADQAVYHDFIKAPTTCAAAKRLYCVFVADGPLDLGRLRRAVRYAVAQHSALRTSLRMVDGELAQVIREPPEITEEPTVRASWDGSPEATADIILGLDDWWTVPRELAIRCVLAYAPDGRTLVACLFNHTCVDGIAVELVIDLIRREYDDPSGEARPERVEQFSDYYPALLAEGLSDSYGDWRKALGSAAPAVPEWMLERKLASEKGWTRYLAWELSDPLNLRVRELTKKYRCTAFEALAVCAAVYFRRADERPFGLGVTHSGRHRPRGLEVVGLLRSFVLDVAEFRAGQMVRDAFEARRDAFRRSTDRLGRLPVEEACRRAGVSTGWRAGTLGVWQVELNGMYEQPLSGTIGGFAVTEAPAAIPEEDHGENSGPCFLISFTVVEGRVRVVLRHADPPVPAALARQVAGDLDAMVEYVAAGPDRTLAGAPAFFDRAPEPTAPIA